jgi:hypothetical protein
MRPTTTSGALAKKPDGRPNITPLRLTTVAQMLSGSMFTFSIKTLLSANAAWRLSSLTIFSGRNKKWVALAAIQVKRNCGWTSIATVVIWYGSLYLILFCKQNQDCSAQSLTPDEWFNLKIIGIFMMSGIISG